MLERRRREDPRRQETADAFVRAAAAALAEGLPFAEVSVSLLAERAGRTRTAFYAHFEDRRALLLQLVEPFDADARAAIAPFVRGDGTDGVREAVEALLVAFRRHAHVVRAVVEAAAYDDAVRRFWEALVGRFAQIAAERLARTTDGAGARATALVLTLMTERACAQQVAAEAPAVSDDELVAALTGAWVRALAA